MGGGMQTAATLTRPENPRGFGTRVGSREVQRSPSVQTCRAAPFRRLPAAQGVRGVTENLLNCCVDQVVPSRMLCPPCWRRATCRLEQREGILKSTGGAFITSIARSRIRSAVPSDAARGAFQRHAVG
jgi:hypothetical protein